MIPFAYNNRLQFGKFIAVPLYIAFHVRTKTIWIWKISLLVATWHCSTVARVNSARTVMGARNIVI